MSGGRGSSDCRGVQGRGDSNKAGGALVPTSNRCRRLELSSSGTSEVRVSAELSRYVFIHVILQRLIK